MNHRIRLLQIIFIIWGLVIISRLFYWQVIKAKQLGDSAALQYTDAAIIPASRGTILSSDGFPLATNNDTYLLIVNPQQFPADTLSERILLDAVSATDSARGMIQTARAKKSSWLSFAHYLTYTAKSKLESLQLPGLIFENEPSRSYPEGSPSAYLTGFVGKNSSGLPQGYFGLEGYYDRELSGRTGRIIQEKDAFNRPILLGNDNSVPPQDGSNIRVSIDRTVQFLIADQLKKGLDKYQAVSGTVSVMESATGRILGMVSLPGYDPGAYSVYDPQLYKNPIISDGYEPGSTFKPVVMSSALDAGAIRPDTICDTCTGPAEVSGSQIRSWDNNYYPGSNMSDIILHSDNVGMVFVSKKLGKQKLISYIKKFGFDQLTGIDLQEESTPLLRPAGEWYDIDYATAAFGQGISVTRLQMLTAINAIAEQGLLRPPRLAVNISSSDFSKDIPPADPVRVISSTAAVQMTQMMVNGVDKGAVNIYKPKGYIIAGKTGTAQIPIAGHYDKDKFVASFVGFAPADNPKFTMLVTLQNPKSAPWGSQTAAPLWFDIARDLFRYYRIAPDIPN